jgi:hypothetical protein
MKETNIKLLLLWYNKTKLFFNCHRDSSEHYSFWNKILGFPVIIINLFNSSSLLANNTNISSTLVLIIGGLSILSTILTGTQNYFEFAKLKDQHTKTMIEYSKINFSIEKLLITIQNDPLFEIDEVLLNKILSDIEKLKETYLHIPEKIWNKNNLLFKLKLDGGNLNTSDSVNMIINSLKNKKNDSATNDSELVTYNNDTKIDIPKVTINLNEDINKNNNKNYPSVFTTNK